MAKTTTGTAWRKSIPHGEFTVQANEIPKDRQGIWIPSERLLYTSLRVCNSFCKGEPAHNDSVIDALEIVWLE